MIDIKEPEGTLVMADSHCVVASPPGIWPCDGTWADNQNKARSLRHNQGANVLFCDWHVKWLGKGAMQSHTPNTAAKGMWSITRGD